MQYSQNLSLLSVQTDAVESIRESHFGNSIRDEMQDRRALKIPQILILILFLIVILIHSFTLYYFFSYLHLIDVLIVLLGLFVFTLLLQLFCAIMASHLFQRKVQTAILRRE